MDMMPRRSQITGTDAWATVSLTDEYRSWRAAEERALIGRIRPGITIVDYCCGDCRIADPIISRGAQYLGCDLDAVALDRARQKYGTAGGNFKVARQDCFDYAANLTAPLPEIACILGNTLSLLPRSPKDVFCSFAATASELLIVSVIAKGNLGLRIAYYQSLGVEFRVDSETETISSALWGPVQAFSEAELAGHAQSAGFTTYSIEEVTKLGLMLTAKLR